MGGSILIGRLKFNAAVIFTDGSNYGKASIFMDGSDLRGGLNI